MEKGDNKLKIDVDPILQNFECLVCMNHFRSPHITKCGHSFCEECIFECLNIKKQCPHCNEPLQVDQVFKNYQLEDLLKQLLDAKKAESEKYYNQIANNGIGEGEHEMANKSPIEMVFLLNLRDGLLKYQKHYQSLLDEKAKHLEKLDKKFAIKAMEEDENKESIEQEKQQRIQEVEQKFGEVIDMLVQNYSAHIGVAIPDPSSLPVRVSVVLVKKDIELKEIPMKPFDCINDIIRVVEGKMEERLNPIESWGEDIEVYIRGPLAIKPKVEEAKDEWDIDAGMNADEVLGKSIKVDNFVTTREKLKIENGSTIEFYGAIKCKSDMPKKCMKANFNKDAKLQYNYYKCNTCNLKWICEACMDACHSSKGHTVQIFLENHVPDWACCY